MKTTNISIIGAPYLPVIPGDILAEYINSSKIYLCIAPVKSDDSKFSKVVRDRYQYAIHTITQNKHIPFELVNDTETYSCLLIHFSAGSDSIHIDITYAEKKVFNYTVSGYPDIHIFELRERYMGYVADMANVLWSLEKHMTKALQIKKSEEEEE